MTAYVETACWLKDPSAMPADSPVLCWNESRCVDNTNEWRLVLVTSGVDKSDALTIQNVVRELKDENVLESRTGSKLEWQFPAVRSTKK